MCHCGYMLVSCLFTVTLLSCNVAGFRLAPEKSEVSGSLAWSNGEKSPSAQKEKLLLLNELVHLENDAMEIKKKRSFPGGNTPMDRLSVSTMDVKSKQKYHTGEGGSRKVVDIPRRRANVPIDRIGTGRLPGNRG